MIDVLNLALPYFGLIFIGFACGRAKGLPETGLAWMNFFLLYVSLPALLFGIMSKTPFEEINNPPFLVATTLGTMSTFAPCPAVRPDHRAAVVPRGDTGRPFRRLR
jgi:malonate transporter